jgi:hypothetical protein
MEDDDIKRLLLKTFRDLIDKVLKEEHGNQTNIDRIISEHLYELYWFEYPELIDRKLNERFGEIKDLIANSRNTCRLSEQTQNEMKYMLAATSDNKHGEIRKSGLKEIRDFTSDAKELIIIDPYMFGGKNVNADSYVEEFQRSARIGGRSLEKIHIIYDSGAGNTTAIKSKIKRIAREKGCKLSSFNTDKIHDRIWIKDRNEAILVGTSFGGIGNRLCFILELPNLDLKALLEYLHDEKMLLDSPL